MRLKRWWQPGQRSATAGSRVKFGSNRRAVLVNSFTERYDLDWEDGTNFVSTVCIDHDGDAPG
jgi:hypothetical protein